MIPERQATTRATMKALNEREFSIFSVSKILVSDNINCFTYTEFRQFRFELRVTHVTTSPYYPLPSHAECFNKNLRAALIAYHSKANDTWDQKLTRLQLAFNTVEHESTKTASFVVVFALRSGSRFLNLWKLNDLLPEKCNKMFCRRNE
jgi:transposase InsO family protein